MVFHMPWVGSAGYCCLYQAEPACREAWIPDMQLDMVLRLGVSPDRIVFANACKRPRDIRAAASKQVRHLTVAMKRQQPAEQAVPCDLGHSFAPRSLTLVMYICCCGLGRMPACE